MRSRSATKSASRTPDVNRHQPETNQRGLDRQLRRAADQTSIFLTDEAVKALPLLLAWPSANSSAEISRNDIA